MITAQSRLGEVTAQSRRGHSSVTARSQLSHGEITAQSRHLQYDYGSVTVRSQLNHGPGHGSVTAGCDLFGHRELTVSSLWAVTVANFFSHGWASLICQDVAVDSQCPGCLGNEVLTLWLSCAIVESPRRHKQCPVGKHRFSAPPINKMSSLEAHIELLWRSFCSSSDQACT